MKNKLARLQPETRKFKYDVEKAFGGPGFSGLVTLKIHFLYYLVVDLHKPHSLSSIDSRSCEPFKISREKSCRMKSVSYRKEWMRTRKIEAV